jgi:hypothetical protein
MVNATGLAPVITPSRTEHVAATPRAEDSERLIETLERRNAPPKTLAIGSAVRFKIDGRARLMAAAVPETTGCSASGAARPRRKYFVGASLYMLTVIALNELHEFGRTGSHHAWQFVARDCGRQACQKFFLRGRQTGTPPPPKQRSDCRPLQAADGQIQRANKKRAAEIKPPLACSTHAGCQGESRCVGRLFSPFVLCQLKIDAVAGSRPRTSSVVGSYSAVESQPRN